MGVGVGVAALARLGFGGSGPSSFSRRIGVPWGWKRMVEGRRKGFLFLLQASLQSE